MSLDVSVHEEGSDITVALDGEMDTHTARSVGEQLAPLAEGRPRQVTVDAAGLRFLDSSGISELLRLRQRIVEDGGSFTVTNATPAVRRVLDITGLTELLGMS
jgi:anti-sigma B factor antagonist